MQGTRADLPEHVKLYRGRVCPRGHDDGDGRSVRHRSSGQCVLCKREQNGRKSTKRGPRGPRGADTILYQLGALPWTIVGAVCPCRATATHYAVALYCGDIALVPVCSACAKKV